MNNKNDIVDVIKHPIFSNFGDVFLEYFPGLPAKRELEFTIELKPGKKCISRAHYHMTTLDLCELQMKLEELLELGEARRNFRIGSYSPKCITLGRTYNNC